MMKKKDNGNLYLLIERPTFLNNPLLQGPSSKRIRGPESKDLENIIFPAEYIKMPIKKYSHDQNELQLGQNLCT